MLHKFKNVIWMILIILTQSSCSTISEFGDTLVSNIPLVNYFTGCGHCTIKIKSNKCTNGGAPFYLLVKATDFPTFLSEDYIKVVQLLDHPLENEPCFGIFCIVPGKDQMITIETSPDIRSIGVYFFFTTPGDIWKQIIELEEGSPVIRIILDGSEIISVG